VRLDLTKGRMDVLLEPAAIEARRAALASAPPKMPPSQTPWQELYRRYVGQLATGACLEPAVLYLNVAEKHGTPRRNH
jgi:dihydroxy-acid dehydratase